MLSQLKMFMLSIKVPAIKNQMSKKIPKVKKMDDKL